MPLLLLVNFLSGVRLELMYISLIVSIKSNLHDVSFPRFSAACAAAKVDRNHFFCLYQQNKFSGSKVKFRQATNHCKRVPEGTKLAYATKTKQSIPSQKLGSRDFWRMGNSVLNKGKSAIPPLFNGLKVLSSASDKTKLFANKHF